MKQSEATGFAVANEFIRLANAEGIELTPMKLLKLVYISHGWFLSDFGKPLISDKIEAWKHGPVIPSIYFKVSKFGYNHIDEQISDFGAGLKIFQKVTDPLIKKFLQIIWDVYKHYNGVNLSTLTHLPDTPWDKVYNQLNKPKGIIPDELIKEHYDYLRKVRS